jgi:hypothetical protein
MALRCRERAPSTIVASPFLPRGRGRPRRHHRYADADRSRVPPHAVRGADRGRAQGRRLPADLSKAQERTKLQQLTAPVSGILWCTTGHGRWPLADAGGSFPPLINGCLISRSQSRAFRLIGVPGASLDWRARVWKNSLKLIQAPSITRMRSRPR